MKRSCHEITKSKSKTTKPPKKRHKVNCFAWLPIEMVQKILEAVPQALDGVTRLVNKAWYDMTDRRWKTRKRHEGIPGIGRLTYPCIQWVLDNPAMSLLKWLVDTIPAGVYIPGSQRSWVNTACQAGNIKAIAWLISQEVPNHVRSSLGRYDVSCVAKRGDLACYKFVVYRSDPLGPATEDIYKACRGGHLDTVQWILEHCGPDKEFNLVGRPQFKACLLDACRGGHKQVVDWLIPHRRDVDESMVFSSAVFGGNLGLTSEHTATAMRHGHLSLAKHLYTHWKCPVGTAVLKEAVYSGNVEGFRFVWDRMHVVYKEEFRIRPWMCVYLRSFDMLNLLAEKDCLKGLDMGLLKRAVRDDEHDLAMLQWVWKHGEQDAMSVELCALTHTCNVVFMKALYSGHLDILDWMQPLGFGWALTDYSRLSILERMASRSQYNNEKDVKHSTVWNTTGNHARGPKASLVWLHRRGLVDLSRARVIHSGKIWLHLNCAHKVNRDCQDRLNYFHKFKLANTPWFEGKPTGEYLIARRARKYDK